MGIQYLQGFWLHPLEIKVFPRWNPLIAGGFLAMASEADNRPKRLEETGDPGTWKRTSAAFNSSVGWWLVSVIFHDFPAQYIWDDDNPRRESPWTNRYGMTEGFWTQLYITISRYVQARFENLRRVLTGIHKGLFFLPENDLHVWTYFIMLQDINTQVSQVSTCALPRPIPSISSAREGRWCGQNSGPSTPCRGWKLKHRGVTCCKAMVCRAQWMTHLI